MGHDETETEEDVKIHWTEALLLLVVSMLIGTYGFYRPPDLADDLVIGLSSVALSCYLFSKGFGGLTKFLSRE